VRAATGLPSVRIADATTRSGHNHARNAGAAAAQGELLAFCDADDVASPGWLDAIVRGARAAAIVGGPLEYDTLNAPAIRAWRATGTTTTLGNGYGFLPYAPGGNLGVWASVAREIGWDETFTYGSSDLVFAWSAQLAGHRIAFAPGALVHQRFRQSIGDTARQFFRYGVSGPSLYRAFRAAGMPRTDTREALAQWRWIALHVLDLGRTPALRGRWVRRFAFRLGRVVGSLRARIVCL
jgi:glycosyltransferase involved in cell wall biosynthesis